MSTFGDIQEHVLESQREVQDINLYLPGEHVTEEPEPSHICPSRHFLPLLKDALAKLEEAEAIAATDIPAKIKNAISFRQRFATGVEEGSAKINPEVARKYLLSSLVWCVRRGMEILEEENRPQKPLVLSPLRRATENQGGAGSLRGTR